VCHQIELRPMANRAAETPGSDHRAQCPAIVEADDGKNVARWGYGYLVHGSVAVGAVRTDCTHNCTHTRQQIL